MGTTRTIDSNVISKMRDEGGLRRESFRLKADFAGVYAVNNVRAYKNGGEENNAFTVECTGENGTENISGFAFANARVLTDAKIEAKPIKDAVYKSEDIKDHLANAVFMNSLFEDDADYVIPEKIKIIGAAVNVDEDDKPLIPLSRYKYYNQCLRHHRTVVGEKEAFMSRDEFTAYLKDMTESRPSGVPETVKNLTLPESMKEDDMTNWSYTLLLADLSKDE